ncbi:MAG: SLBB domain-containing protein [Planctomycetales bacterium]|nr:SLBB domain-containing protein [Planctomycetales bacterium]
MGRHGEGLARMSERLGWSFAAVVTAVGCAGSASPPRPLPDARRAAAGGEPRAAVRAPAPEPRKLSPEEELFWFGASGAPKAIASGQKLPEVPAETEAPYLLAPGDTLEFRVPEVKDLNRDEVVVAPDGTVALDMIGTVKATGRTAEDVSAEVAKGYAKLYRKASPRLALKKARPREVVVLGPVAQGGRKRLAGQETLLDVLGDAGFGAKSENLRGSVSIQRGARVLTLPAREVLTLSDSRWNVRVKPDDVVVVHTEDPASVAGEVKRPGAVPFPAQGGIPLPHAIALAGGITDDADLQNARIVRADGRAEDVNLNPVLFGGGGGGETPAPLGPGDSLSIPASKQTRVYVFGMVQRPGQIKQAGPISLLQAVAQASPTQFGAVFNDAKLVRGWPERPEVVPVDLDALLFKQDVAWNVELRDGDVVYIPETATSDVLDFLGRALSPISSAATGAGQASTGAAALQNAGK